MLQLHIIPGEVRYSIHNALSCQKRGIFLKKGVARGRKIPPIPSMGQGGGKRGDRSGKSGHDWGIVNTSVDSGGNISLPVPKRLSSAILNDSVS